MNHEELVKEAERLATKLSPDEKADQSFIWSYVANHELRALWREIKQIRGLLMGIGIPILVAVVLGLIAQLRG